jgi:putative phosphoribosyl transferase
MFRNREDAALQLAGKLKGRPFCDPLVLAIPNGGVVIGAILARELGADLDVVLSRKLRAPGRPGLTVGAISESGQVYLDPRAKTVPRITNEYLAEEGRRQVAEIARRRKLFRQVPPFVSVAGRSVLVTDDGILTGSTMIAALQHIKAQDPYELIAAVPVASPDRLPKSAAGAMTTCGWSALKNSGPSTSFTKVSQQSMTNRCSPSFGSPQW